MASDVSVGRPTVRNGQGHDPAARRTETANAAAAGAVPDRLDLPFAVPFVHRTRFTQDVLSAGGDATLLDVLEAAAGKPARVLAIVEQAIDTATGLTARLHELAGRHADAMELIDVVRVEGGEAIKNHADRVLPVLQAMLDGHVDRRNYVLAIGGGAMLDAVGFAAALAHRGVRLVRLPTTTMGQADGGLGVKNVDIRARKTRGLSIKRVSSW